MPCTDCPQESICKIPKMVRPKVAPRCEQYTPTTLASLGDFVEYLLKQEDELCKDMSCTGAAGSINEGVECPFRHPDRPGCTQPPPGRLKKWYKQQTTKGEK